MNVWLCSWTQNAFILKCWHSSTTYICHKTPTMPTHGTQIFTVVTYSITNTHRWRERAVPESVFLFLESCRIWSHLTSAEWPSWKCSPHSCSRNAVNLAKTRWRSSRPLGQVNVKNNQFCDPQIAISQELSQSVVNVAPFSFLTQIDTVHQGKANSLTWFQSLRNKMFL